MGYLPNAALFATIGDILVSLRIIPSLKGAGKCYEKEKYKASDPAAHHFIHLGQLVRGTEPRRGKVGGFTFTAARAIPAVLVLGALVLILRRVRHEEKYTPQQKKDLLEGGLVCGIFLTLGTNLQQFGIADTTAGKAGFITALYIVLVPLAGMFLGKKANKRLFLCVLIAVVGLYFLCFTGSEGAMSFGRGDFLVFLCAFAFTGHILCVDHYVQKVDGHRALLRAVRGDDGPLHRLCLHL